MVVFLYTNGHYEHLFNLQAADFDRPQRCVTDINWPLSHTMPSLKSIWRICICCDVHYYAYLKVKVMLMAENYNHIKFGFLFFFSVKEDLRGTVKRQTEHSNTLRRWMLTLTWLRLTWKRYVSSHCRAPITSHASLSYTLHASHKRLAFLTTST